MKKKLLFTGTALSILAMAGCGNPPAKDAEAQGAAAAPANDTARISGIPCDLKLAGIHFTKCINGADTLATPDDRGIVKFRVGEKKDYFSDPNGKLSNNTAPILLAQVDNTKPFTLVSKVTPAFTEKGLYNAGVLYIYVHDNFWQKFCFEQDERGRHRMVTVRTIGTSDDNNHDVVTTPSVYMKVSSDTRTVASYYSNDRKTWNLVRLYKNNYPAKIWMGISAQCPVDTGSSSLFEETSLTQSSVKDFRLGD